jgi:hypothetical protein
MKNLLIAFTFALLSISTEAFASPGHAKDQYTCTDLATNRVVLQVTYEKGRYENTEFQRLAVLEKLSFAAGSIEAGVNFLSSEIPESVNSHDCTDGSSIFVSEIDSTISKLIFYCAIDSTGNFYERIASLRCE